MDYYNWRGYLVVEYTISFVESNDNIAFSSSGKSNSEICKPVEIAFLYNPLIKDINQLWKQKKLIRY